VSEHATTLVGSVEPGMPAAAAGIRPGDRIVAVNGTPVRVFEEISEQLQSRYDRPTALTIERDGQRLTLTLTPERSTESDALESVTRGQIGIRPFPLPPVLGVPAGSAAAAAGLRSFDRVVAIGGTPVRDERDLVRALAQARGELEVEVYRAVPLHVPGVGGTNPQVVRVKLARQAGEGYAALGAEPSTLYVHDVLPGSPAARAGLVLGDRLLSLDGAELHSFLAFSNALNEKVKDRPFTLAWRTAAGEERSAKLRQVPSTEKNALGNPSGQLYLGVAPRSPGPEEVLNPETVEVRLGPGKALVKSARIVPQVTAKIAMVIGYMITGKVSMEIAGGPIMLHQMATRAAEEGLDNFLRMMALISINLGLVNLLPIPILDGFHLLAAAWEAIRRRPISMRAREIANWVGLVMLVSLIARVFYNDLFRR